MVPINFIMVEVFPEEPKKTDYIKTKIIHQVLLSQIIYLYHPELPLLVVVVVVSEGKKKQYIVTRQFKYTPEVNYLQIKKHLWGNLPGIVWYTTQITFPLEIISSFKNRAV